MNTSVVVTQGLISSRTYESMLKYFALKTYRHWISRNGHRFRHRPYLSMVGRKYFELKFQGINRRIRCLITKSGAIEIWVHYQGEPWDILAEFDLVERRSDSGQYFCALCIEPTMYQSRRDLWIEHSLEPLLEWSNENLTESQWLCIFGIRDRYTSAKLKHADKIEEVRGNTDIVYACPVLA